MESSSSLLVLSNEEAKHNDKPSKQRKQLIKDALQYKEKLEKRGVIYL